MKKMSALAVICLFVSFLYAPYALAQSAALEDTIRVQLKAAKEARINAPMTGKISKVHFKDGQSVKKGQKLVSFSCSKERAGVAQAQARINKHSKLLDSTRQLFDLGSASQTDIDILIAELAEAKASRDFSNAQVRDCFVTAPFSGRIASLSVKSHFSIQEGEEILELVGTGAMEIDMIIPSKWIRWVKKGEKFQIDIDETGGSYEAQIERLGGRVDPVTQTVKAYGKIISAHDDLLPGMSGRAIFDLPQQNEAAMDEGLKETLQDSNSPEPIFNIPSQNE